MKDSSWAAAIGQSSVVLFMALTVPAVQAKEDHEHPKVTYDESPQTVVVSFREILGELAEQDPAPLIRIFGDGRVLAHYPEYMQEAGDYELRLSTEDLRAKIRSLVAKGLVTFDSDRVREQKRAELARRQTEALSRGESPRFFFVADDSISVFELNLESYRSPGLPGLTLAPVQRKIAYLGLATDAERFADLEAIQQLHRAELELRQLLERGDLQRAGNGAP